MAQTRKGSFTEAATNAGVGWSVNFIANLILLPLLYDPARLVESALWIGVAFTFISIARSYLLRRLFEVTGWFQVEAVR